MKIRFEKLLLPAIIIIALAIRLYSIAAKLPYTYWHDENSYIETALRFGRIGNTGLITYAHGSLYQAALFIFYLAYFAAGKILGLFHSPIDFCLSYLKDPTVFFIIARSISVFCGTAIVYLSYLIAAAMYNRRAALVASTFVTFSLIMVQMSSVALADMMSIFILLSAVLLLVRSIEKLEDKRMFYIASFLIGLAAGCKYYSVFGAAPLYIAAIIKCRSSKSPFRTLFTFIIFASALVGAGFFVGMPFSISQFHKFYGDTFIKAVDEYIVRNPNKYTWLFYFTNHMRNGLGIPLEAAAILGTAYALYKRSRWDILMISFPAAYYLLLSHSISFAYHMLPAIPFILILAGRLLDAVSDKYFQKYSSVALICLSLIVISPTFLDSIKYVKVLTSKDTRTEANTWIKENIPSGARILSEGYIFTLAVHAPPLPEDLNTLKRDLEYTISKKGSGFFIKLKIANFEKEGHGKNVYDVFKAYKLNTEDVDKYGPSYVILSGSNDIVTGVELSYYLDKDHYLKREELRKRLSRDYELIKVFSPTPVFSSMFPHMVDLDYRAIRRAPLNRLSDYKSGPRIEIYKFKNK